MRSPAITSCLFLVIAVLLVYAASLVPHAMDAQAAHNQRVAESRCTVNGDFDDSTAYCRAVAKWSGQ
jgi:hypothetical protein